MNPNLIGLVVLSSSYRFDTLEYAEHFCRHRLLHVDLAPRSVFIDTRTLLTLVDKLQIFYIFFVFRSGFVLLPLRDIN
jgi:hypothetical protein